MVGVWAVVALVQFYLGWVNASAWGLARNLLLASIGGGHNEGLRLCFDSAHRVASWLSGLDGLLHNAGWTALMMTAAHAALLLLLL